MSRIKNDKLVHVMVTAVAPTRYGMINGSEKKLPNMSNVKIDEEGRAYASGQKQAHALMMAIDRLNTIDQNNGDTYVSNGDGVTNNIAHDLRADMRGYMHPELNNYGGRRTAPLWAVPAFSKEPVRITRDLLIRLVHNDNLLTKVELRERQAANENGGTAVAVQEKESADGNQMAITTREMVTSADFIWAFGIDVANLSISKRFAYDKRFHVETKYEQHCTVEERKRRIALFLEASGALEDYANQARNACSLAPQMVLIVMDTRYTKKYARFWTATPEEQQGMIKEITSRGGAYFIGDDRQLDGENSVAEAYDKALDYLDQAQLYTPA